MLAAGEIQQEHFMFYQKNSPKKKKTESLLLKYPKSISSLNQIGSTDSSKNHSEAVTAKWEDQRWVLEN